MSELSSNPRFFQVFNAMIADIGVYSFAVYTAPNTYANTCSGLHLKRLRTAFNAI